MKSEMRVCGFLAAVLILTSVGPVVSAESTSIHSEYKRKVKAIDPADPAAQIMTAMWCLDHNMKSKHSYHYRLFLKSRGENARKKNPDGYCSTCNGQREYVCDVCNKKRYINVKCPDCAATGKIVCRACNGNGKIMCPRCRGSGSFEKTEVIVGAKRKVLTRTIDCPKEVLCRKCRGKKFVRCPTCYGTKIKKKICIVCNKYRFRKCPKCSEQSEKLNERILKSSLAASTPSTASETPLPDEEVTAPPDDLDKGSLIEKGDSLLAKGLSLDRQALIINTDEPYPVMKRAEKKYEEAISCYKAAQKKGRNVDEKLKEAMTMLFWLRKMMPIK